MKKIILSIITAFMGLAFFATGVQAESYNTDPQDYPTILVCKLGNCTNTQGVGNWTSTLNANPGDIVMVQVYYHNSTSITAANSTVSIKPQSTPSSTSHTFTGGVASTSIDRAVGSATVYTGTNQTLTFIPGSVQWSKSISNTQGVSNEYSLFASSGFNIGDIAPGWGTQGVLTANYQVSNNNNNNNQTTYCSLNLTGSQSTVSSGNPVTLSWSSSNCTNLQLSNYGSVSNSSGNTVVYPTGTTTYVLTGSNLNGTGTVQGSYTVYVNGINYPTNNTCYVTNFTPDQSSITRGTSTTLRWGGSNLNYVVINGNTYYGNSLYVSPITTTDYTMTAYCTNGATATSYTRINVDNSNSNIQAITTTATVLGTTGARLNGIAITNNSSSALTGWFEYGTTASLGKRTSIQNISNGSSVSLSDVVYDLMPNTVYYYRVIIQNSTNSTYGELVRFQTQKGVNDSVIVKSSTKTTKAQTVIKTNTVVAESAASLLQLKVVSQFDSMCINGDIQYTVSYQNLSNQTLNDAILRISHPKELSFVASSQGVYSVTDRTITVDLRDIAPGATGLITLNLKVNSDAVRGNLSVTTATVVYTNTFTKAQEDAIAYSLVTVTDTCPTNNVLGASAFGTTFLPHTLIEWLLLILIIMALVVLGRQAYNKKKNPTV